MKGFSSFIRVFKQLLTSCTILLIFSASAQAINLSEGERPDCSGQWSINGNTYTCQNGSIEIEDATVTADEPFLLFASQGISVENSTVEGSLEAQNGSIEISDGSFIQGNLTANGSIEIDESQVTGSVNSRNGSVDMENSTVSGNILANGDIEIEDSRVSGSIRSGNNEVNVDNSIVSGNVEAPNGTIDIAESLVAGNLIGQNQAISIDDSTVNGAVTTSNGDIDIEDGSEVFGDIFTQNGNLSIDDSSNAYATCTPNHPRCGATPPPLDSQCERVWPRDATQSYQTSNPFPAPANPDFTSLPTNNTLQQGDYVIQGPISIGTSGSDITVSTSGTTTRIYINGDLQIGATDSPGRSPRVRLNYNRNNPGPAENLVVIVNGDLTVGERVSTSGYFFVSGDVNVAATGGGNNSFLVDGALTATGELSQDFSNNTDISYREPPDTLDTGGFCEAVASSDIQTTLSLQLNDGPWASEPEEVIDSGPMSLNGRAFNGVGFSRENPAISTNPAGLGTCGYATFDASQQQYIEVPHSTNLSMNEPFTVGVWVRPRSLPNSGLMTILSKDTNYEFHLNPNGTVNWWWHNRNGNPVPFDSNHRVNLNEWNYVAIRYRDNEQTIFVNGQKTTRANNQGISQNNVPVQIGSDQNFAGRYFNGDIDEVTIVKNDLTDAEIEELSQRVSECAPEVAQCFPVYQFDQAESLESRWIVRPAQTTGGNRKPRIVDNALRLTDNVGNQSTLVSLRRIFPAAGNIVEIEFKLNAYGGTGADGIAVVLSDANQSPEPGGYGGSLGYAQRSGISGFNGGWLGIGFDSFGNYAQQSEGRVGGLGIPRNRTTNMVSMRGASQTNYRFVNDGNSPQLSPGLRRAGSTRGPGHNYRIRIDSRSVDESFVSVERDTGDGFEFIIEPIDIYEALDGQQPAVPDNFRLSFTGSTGGSTDIHELEDISVCAALSAPIDGGIDHLRLQHPGALVSCYAAELELIACMDADCATQSTQDGQVTLQATPEAQWQGNAVISSGTNNANIALNSGRASVQLSRPEGGTVDITPISTSYPLASGFLDLRCFVGTSEQDCNILYNTAGFVFYDSDRNITSIPNQVSGVDFNAWLRAVQTNTLTGACEARLEGSQQVNLGYECQNPGQCQSGQSMTIAGTEINNGGSGIASSPTQLVFNADGYARLNPNMYTDAGQIRVHATATLDEEPRGETGITDPTVTISGSSNPFVVKPHELKVTTPALQNLDNGFAAAGEAFTLQVQALNALGQVTPNFGSESAALRAQPQAEFDGLILPENGRGDASLFSTGDLTRANSPQGIVFESETAAWQEAGSIRVRPSLRGNNYLGAGDIEVKTSADIGRFYPAYFEVSRSEIEDICVAANNFSYLEQPGIRASYEVTARAINENVTENYTPYGNGSSHLATIAFVSGSPDIANSRVLAPQNSDWVNGVLDFQSAAEDIIVTRSGSGLTPEGPYPAARLGLEIEESLDPARFEGSTLLDNTLDLRYGRLVLADVSGPEDEPLRVDASAEFWDGERFVVNVDDFCTRLESASVSLESAVDSSFNIADITVSASQPGDVTLRNGLTQPDHSLVLSPSNELVEIEYCYQTPPWLQHIWNNGVSCENSPSALAIFGQYRGNDRIIFWLERGL